MTKSNTLWKRVGGIDKAEVVLVGFAKTDRLKPGESGTVTITFDTDDLASYDYCHIFLWILNY
ncbi:MAG TPA: fibronectin type III-like domain-contianing protein [Candidatus Coproplasma stercoripullorum]|uniref:Fibronectin type III-like domain-contianing protein n=1 Tax=Candidatus Coproplasma stercoripullorum TaxID=2840751 RepID=A0A9D1AHM4_9FIRM|nr:fibronectin type III-like domain-contianing protein [Candidatus Coproplasma stercoripullorum]